MILSISQLTNEMTKAEWDDFIDSEKAMGAVVRIEVPADERSSWPISRSIEKHLRKTDPGSRVVQFDLLMDRATGVVVSTSYCGWLKVEIADHGTIDVPGRYLKESWQL